MLLVIANDLYVGRPEGSFDPFKADPPLLVNTNAVLALSVAAQCFKRLPGKAARSPSDVAASIRSSLRRAGRSKPENAFTRFPPAKSLVRIVLKASLSSQRLLTTSR